MTRTVCVGNSECWKDIEAILRKYGNITNKSIRAGRIECGVDQAVTFMVDCFAENPPKVKLPTTAELMGEDSVELIDLDGKNVGVLKTSAIETTHLSSGTREFLRREFDALHGNSPFIELKTGDGKGGYLLPDTPEGHELAMHLIETEGCVYA